MEALPQPSNPPSQKNQKPLMVIRLMSKRRTWIFLFVVVYTMILYSSWNLLRSILKWHGSSEKLGLEAVYASVMLGAVFGLMSMVAAAAVAFPSMLVTWITVLVLLTFCGRRRRDLILEGRKLTAEICGSVLRILIREGNLVAAAFAVLGYLLLVRRGNGDAEFMAD